MKRRKNKNSLPLKYLLLIMTALCVLIIASSVKLSYSSSVVNGIVGYVIIPMQKGVNTLGTVLADMGDNFTDKEELIQENKALKEQLASAQEELNQVQHNENELQSLRALYDMDHSYSSYEKVPASVIGKNSGNWFSTFVIDKGTKDGIEKDMNVIADGGLCGIVIEVGPNFAKVRSIIDDTSKVSSMDASSKDLCIVNGSLQSMTERNMIEFSNCNDKENRVVVGDQVATSNVSDLFLEGIPIGYITEINTDPNNLTKSGYIATIVDFDHLDSVFVILETKNEQFQRGE